MNPAAAGAMLRLREVGRFATIGAAVTTKDTACLSPPLTTCECQVLVGVWLRVALTRVTRAAGARGAGEPGAGVSTL